MIAQQDAEILQARLLHVCIINKRRFNGWRITSQIIKREREREEIFDINALDFT